MRKGWTVECGAGPRAKRHRNQDHRGTGTLGGFGGVADRLNSYNHYRRTPDFSPRISGGYEKASIESVQAFAQGQLNTNQRVVVYGVPGKQISARKFRLRKRSRRTPLRMAGARKPGCGMAQRRA